MVMTVATTDTGKGVNMNVVIRKAKIEDLEGCVSALENSELSTAYFQTEESRANTVKEAIDSGNTYAAFYGDECVGFVYYIEQGAFHAFHYIHLISVKEDYRGKGIGKELLGYVEKVLFETRDKIFLVVGDYNPGGRTFYEKSGYIYIGTVPNLYRAGVNEDIMMKTHGQK